MYAAGRRGATAAQRNQAQGRHQPVAHRGPQCGKVTAAKVNAYDKKTQTG